MSRQRGLGVLFGLLALAALTLAAWFSPSSGISLGPVDGWISGISGIEQDLTLKTQDRLFALGVGDAEITADGRDISVTLPSGFPGSLDPADLSAELLATKGVRTVTFDAAVVQEPAPQPTATPEPQPTAVPEPQPTAVPEPQPVAAPNEIIARIDLGSVLLSGDLQTEGQRAVVLGGLAGVADTTIADQMQVLAADSTRESDQHVQVAADAIETLASEFASGSVRLTDDVLVVEGLVADQAAANDITASIEAAAAAAGMQADVRMSIAEPQIAEVVGALDLSGVNFESGTDQLRPDAFAILDEVAARLAGASDVAIEVQGHTDDQGGADLNQALSEARATTVAEYLAANGVDASILTVRGYGEAEPIDDNQTEQGRAANRRVELVVIEGN